MATKQTNAEAAELLLREHDTTLLSALSLLPQPLSFSRLTTSSTAGDLFGSVSASDVLAELKEFGIRVEESNAGFEEKEGVEKGRVKSLGEFVCEFALFALSYAWCMRGKLTNPRPKQSMSSSRHWMRRSRSLCRSSRRRLPRSRAWSDRWNYWVCILGEVEAGEGSPRFLLILRLFSFPSTTRRDDETTSRRRLILSLPMYSSALPRFLQLKARFPSSPLPSHLPPPLPPQSAQHHQHFSSSSPASRGRKERPRRSWRACAWERANQERKGVRYQGDEMRRERGGRREELTSLSRLSNPGSSHSLD